jgi:hypothetical protein
MPGVVYKEEVMGRRCSVAFQTDGHRDLQFYAGRITKYRCEMELIVDDDQGVIINTYEHHISFEDGDEVWFDLAMERDSGRLKWLHDGRVKTERDDDTQEVAATIKQEFTNAEQGIPEVEDRSSVLERLKDVEENVESSSDDEDVQPDETTSRASARVPVVAGTPLVAVKAPRAATLPVKRKRAPAVPLITLCRMDNWQEILKCVRANPSIATTHIVMKNQRSTTILHQAISSQGDTVVRASVISAILHRTPEAAAIENTMGSLPLHVITRDGIKMDARTKERLIPELVQVFPGALLKKNGVAKRTPLHILLWGVWTFPLYLLCPTLTRTIPSPLHFQSLYPTGYTTPRLVKMMIDNGRQACFMKDIKGFLPAHVACSRHCSPEKLRMLLAVNPDALFDKTNDNETMLDLAKKMATKNLPNCSLINELIEQMQVTSEKLEDGHGLRTPEV